LRLVRGLPAALVDAALPFVTVFNGKAEIDINEAAPEVIAALPRMNPSTVADILKRRDPQNPQAVLSLLGEARASVTVEDARRHAPPFTSPSHGPEGERRCRHSHHGDWPGPLLRSRMERRL